MSISSKPSVLVGENIQHTSPAPPPSKKIGGLGAINAIFLIYGPSDTCFSNKKDNRITIQVPETNLFWKIKKEINYCLKPVLSLNY